MFGLISKRWLLLSKPARGPVGAIISVELILRVRDRWEKRTPFARIVATNTPHSPHVGLSDMSARLEIRKPQRRNCSPRRLVRQEAKFQSWRRSAQTSYSLKVPT